MEVKKVSMSSLRGTCSWCGVSTRCTSASFCSRCASKRQTATNARKAAAEAAEMMQTWTAARYLYQTDILTAAYEALRDDGLTESEYRPIVTHGRRGAYMAELWVRLVPR